MAKTFLSLVTAAVIIVVFVEIGLSTNLVYDVEKVPAHCLEAPPVDSNYTPTGTTWQLGNMTIYETLNKTPSRILIDVYDIFGYTDNTKQVADLLAIEGNFRIVMPDFFRGSPFNKDNFPPKDPRVISTFLQERGDWEDTVRADTKAVIEHFRRTENVTEFGMFGFCWGGKITTQAASELKEIKVAALVHPSSVANAEANNVTAPMYLLPSMSEPDMLPFYEVLQSKGDNCGHRRFNLSHGFAGARGNFSDPENIRAVGEVISIITGFFNSNLV